MIEQVTGTALAIVVMMSYSYHMGEHLLTFVLDAKAVEEFTLVGLNALCSSSETVP